MAELLEAGPVHLRRSPLAHMHEVLQETSGSGERAASLEELPFLTMLSLRVSPGTAAFDRVGEALGAALPEACGETSGAGAHTALWLGPDEWLVVSRAEAGTLAGCLLAALDGEPGSVVDVSANRTTLQLSGPRARQVLEKGCPVDLHPRSFTPGRAVATTLGPVPVLLWQVDGTSYRLLPRASFADYLARWLLDSMREYAVREES